MLPIQRSDHAEGKRSRDSVIAAIPQVERMRVLPTCRASRFAVPGAGAEVHLTIEPDGDGTFSEQLQRVVELYHRSLSHLGLAPHTAVFRRVYLSDVANQLPLALASAIGEGCEAGAGAAVSYVEQAPLPYRKVALHAYHVSDVAPEDKALVALPDAGPHARALLLRRTGQTQLWTTQMSDAAEGHCCCEQTRRLFTRYCDLLAVHGASLDTDVLRTWVFVHDVDNNYGDMVAARRELFDARGLTADTHYLVSTGIEGRTAQATSVVLLDALAIPGLIDGQLTYVDALDHLNRTSDYGVTFERAARLDHADRSHILLSGTASIDDVGRVVHEGDVLGQTHRTVENIDALLAAAGAEFADLATLTVYLRDPADAARVGSLLHELAPDLPYVMCHAPVCRPGWLIEIEGIAIRGNDDRRWPAF